MLEDRTFFVSSAGWTDDTHAQVEIPVDVSFCPHAMGKSAEAGCFQVPNADAEWRFRGNPLVNQARPIKFFASASTSILCAGLESCILCAGLESCIASDLV